MCYTATSKIHLLWSSFSLPCFSIQQTLKMWQFPPPPPPPQKKRRKKHKRLQYYEVADFFIIRNSVLVIFFTSKRCLNANVSMCLTDRHNIALLFSMQLHSLSFPSMHEQFGRKTCTGGGHDYVCMVCVGACIEFPTGTASQEIISSLFSRSDGTARINARCAINFVKRVTI